VDFKLYWAAANDQLNTALLPLLMMVSVGMKTELRRMARLVGACRPLVCYNSAGFTMVHLF
jgi:hypothetical protein